MAIVVAAFRRKGSTRLSLKFNGGRSRPVWAQALVSLALLYHIAAILAGALAVHPSSEIQRRAAGIFRRYYELINQGYGHRYYSRLDTTVDRHDPRPWGTPVIIAELKFDQQEGKDSSEIVRIPSRDLPWIRLRHQRQLDLAYHLATDPRWAASYARHLCRTRGCQGVTIYTQQHNIPDLAVVREAAAGPGSLTIDLEAESTYGPHVKLGEFRCTDF
jgi:hypothetical protein